MISSIATSTDCNGARANAVGKAAGRNGKCVRSRPVVSEREVNVDVDAEVVVEHAVGDGGTGWTFKPYRIVLITINVSTILTLRFVIHAEFMNVELARISVIWDFMNMAPA